MQKTSQTLRWWDWSSIFILFLLLETVATRLVTTNWTGFLFLGQTVTYLAFVIGTILGYTRFSPRLARWVSFLYMLILLPLQWTLMIDQNTSLEEQLLSVGGRLYFSLADFFARRPVEDPILFIAFISLVFWIISTSAGFRLVRKQNYLMAVVPSAVGLLMLQSYDNSVAGRIWILAFYAFLALLLLGRLNYLENKRSWRERRVFLSPDNSIDLTSTMAIAAGLIILFSWTPPASVASLDSAVRSWNRVTRPWREFTQRMENAFSSLESPSGGVRGEFFGSEIALGRGFPQSDSVMFTVKPPAVPEDQKPPRFYWRGRTYDYFSDGQWYTNGSNLEDYSPAESVPFALSSESPAPERFVFSTGELTFSLVYAPSQTEWLSRQGSIRTMPAGNREDVISWYASPALLPGEIYQADAVLNNPDIAQLRQAGTNYPAWITGQYLQLPDSFSKKVSDLAREITAEYDNPYDKAAAVTAYLRNTIEYADTLSLPPRNADPLEWMLFESKKAYCVYYSSAEILMLRSLGIPARMAVGFAQGERDGNDYIVRRNDAHAWPEVYFPAIGWVEFEPTGSQPALSRPQPPSDEQNNGASSLSDPGNLDNNRENFRGLQEEGTLAVPDQTTVTQTVNLSRYLIPILFLIAALMIFFSRRYSVPARLPGILRITYERTGFQIPNWVVNWERWVSISQIQRSFESINFALGLLKRPLPIHATPIERANELIKILPRAGNHTQILLDEHQTSLYTSRKADALRARRAALNIQKYALFEAVRYIFEGRPIRDP
jgi:transglutaminase-like putative cysteine protease